jgi:putative ribosome biogenesis GTPase RsgA
MNSAHLYRSIQIIRVRLRYKEIKKSNITVNRNEFKVGDNVRVKLHNKTFEPGKILEVLNRAVARMFTQGGHTSWTGGHRDILK